MVSKNASSSALVEAKEKYAEWRAEKENKAEQDLQKMSKKPAPYKHIKVRKFCIRTGGVQQFLEFIFVEFF